MTKSGVNEMWQVFEWKHIISTSNSWISGYDVMGKNTKKMGPIYSELF